MYTLNLQITNGGPGHNETWVLPVLESETEEPLVEIGAELSLLIDRMKLVAVSKRLADLHESVQLSEG